MTDSVTNIDPGLKTAIERVMSRQGCKRETTGSTCKRHPNRMWYHGAIHCPEAKAIVNEARKDVVSLIESARNLGRQEQAMRQGIKASNDRAIQGMHATLVIMDEAARPPHG